MPRVIHFELPAEDPERACRFYAAVFGWTAQNWGDMGYWMLNTASGEAEAVVNGKTAPAPEPGIDGAISRSQGDPFPAKAATNVIGVPSVDEYTAKIETAGGEIVVPKMPVPTVGWLAYCRDTEGVVFGIMQFDPNAA